MKPSAWQGICLVFRKELTAGLRFRAAWAAMLMFALTTLACASMALQGGSLEPRMQAALLWIILFFASMAGADRVFADESTAGTLLTLRVYGASQAVLFGKLCYTFSLLLVLAAFTVPLFLVFLDVTVKEPLVLLGAVLLGTGGIAAAGTLIAALTTDASTHSGLFSVLMLPVILPVFLPAISLTALSFGADGAGSPYLGAMALYDAILAVGASVLFDSLWYED